MKCEVCGSEELPLVSIHQLGDIHAVCLGCALGDGHAREQVMKPLAWVMGYEENDAWKDYLESVKSK